MNLRCINNDGLESVLTVGREYKGEYSPHKIYVYVYRADDKKPGFFHPNRFEEVDTVLSEPETKVNQYFLYTEKS